LKQRAFSCGITWRATAAALALAFFCAAVPVRAEPTYGRYEPVEIKDSEQQLMKTTADYEDLFKRRGYRYDSADLEALVSRVGTELAPKPTDPYIRYRFHLLRDVEPNAFALPDGQVYVNTGILALLDNEAQLAALLAHEVQHTAGHHGILAYRSVRRKIITSMVLGPITLGISDVFLALSLYGYSRELEEEADRRGAERLVKCGYDPRQMPKLFELLMQDPEGERPRVGTKWSTHPELQSRIDYTRAMLPKITWGQDPGKFKVGAQGYRRLARRVALDTVQDLVDADYPFSAVALAKRLIGENEADAEAHLAMGDARYAQGARAPFDKPEEQTNKAKWHRVYARGRYTRSELEEKRRATPEGQQNLRRNLEAARRSYLRALGLNPGLPEAHRGLGFVLDEMGRPVEAGREFVIYLKARPQATDRQVVLAQLAQINDKIKKGGRGK
jgi:predicted Zn-dependent protease